MPPLFSESMYYFPSAIHPIVLGLVFVGALVFFHAAYVYAWPLSKRRWKQVDYVWLSVGLLGLYGAASGARQDIARAWLHRAEERHLDAAQAIVASVKVELARSTCRTFVRSEWSPPAGQYDSLQQSYNAACEKSRTLAATFSVDTSLRSTAASRKALAAVDSFPDQTGEMIAMHLRLLDEAVYARAQLEALADRNSAEWLLAVLGPAALAIALALRITKVTGELRLERLVTSENRRSEAPAPSDESVAPPE